LATTSNTSSHKNISFLLHKEEEEEEEEEEETIKRVSRA
jgi:hypothetical protein